MEIIPLGDRVLIKKREIDKIGSIVIPDQYKQYTDYADVIYVSDEVKKVRPGDIVLVGKYTGTVFEIEGEQMILIREEDIIGLVKNER